jgi:LacI family transcriptional regulator
LYLEERGPRDTIPSWLKAWRGDGIISRTQDEPMAEALLPTGAPVVELRRQVTRYDLPSVHCDDAAISHLAIRHLQEKTGMTPGEYRRLHARAQRSSGS